MKKIQYAKDFHRIKSLIDDSRVAGHEICLWQKNNDSLKRIIHNVKIEKNLFEAKKIWFKSTHTIELKFSQTTTFYYCHELKIVFKTILISKEDQMICLAYPEEVTMLEENDSLMEEFAWMKSGQMEEEFSWISGKKADAENEWTEIEGKKTVDGNDSTKVHGKKAEEGNDLTTIQGKKAEKENDLTKIQGENSEKLNDVVKIISSAPNEKEVEGQYKALRESARLAPKEDKHVTLVKDSAPENQIEYKLFDLSQGGAGILIFSPTAFKIGENISIVAIDKKVIDKVLKGTVVAIRPYDEGKGEYKLGIKFS